MTKLNNLSKEEIRNILLTVAVTFIGFAGFFTSEHSLEKTLGEKAVGAICFGSMCLIVGVLYAIINRKLIEEQWKKMLHHKKEVALWACIGAVFVYVIMTLNHHLFHGPHHAYSLEANSKVGLFSPLLIIGMSFGMAFVEEVSYKVCCFLPVEGLGLKKASLVAAVLYGTFMAIIFGIFAPSYAFGAFLMYTLLGLKFGLLYYNTHTIFTSIFAGTIYGIVTIVLLFI